MKKTLSVLMALVMLMGMTTLAVAQSPAKAELNVMLSFPRYMDQWEDYAKQFEEKMLQEQNIEVTVNIEMPSSDQYDSLLQARLAGDDAPDLYALHANNLGVYNTAGHLTALTDQPLAEKLYPDIKNTVSLDGEVLAVPLESMAWGVLYNKDIFDACELEIPRTLTELTSACEVLKENGYTPFMLAFQEQWVPQLMTGLTLGGLVSGEKTDWLDRMYADEASYEEVREIFDVIQLIMDNGTSRAMEQGSQQGAADFAVGKAAMFVQGTWAASTIMETNPEMHLGVMALPVNDDINCTRVNLSTSTVVGVHPQTQEMDLALAFANYILDDEDSSALFESCGFNPLATCHEYPAAYWVEDASKYVADGYAYQDLVLPSAVTDEQGKLLQELYVGTVTVDEIIESLDATFQNANKLSN